MAYMGKDTSKNFFAAAMANRLSMLPAGTALSSYSNGADGATSASAYNSNVLASQTNGSGPIIPPINAPYSFADFATGKKSLTTANSPVKVNGRKIFGRF